MSQCPASSHGFTQCSCSSLGPCRIAAPYHCTDIYVWCPYFPPASLLTASDSLAVLGAVHQLGAAYLMSQTTLAFCLPGIPWSEGGHQLPEPHHPQPLEGPARLRAGLLRPNCTQQVCAGVASHRL